MKKISLLPLFVVLISACGQHAPDAASDIASKQQAALKANEEMQKGFEATKPASIPPLDTSTKTYKKSNLYPPK